MPHIDLIVKLADALAVALEIHWTPDELTGVWKEELDALAEAFDLAPYRFCDAVPNVLGQVRC